MKILRWVRVACCLSFFLGAHVFVCKIFVVVWPTKPVSQRVNHPTNHVTNDNYQNVLKWKNSDKMHTLEWNFQSLSLSFSFPIINSSRSFYIVFIFTTCTTCIDGSFPFQSINECINCVVCVHDGHTSKKRRTRSIYILLIHNNGILVVKCFNELCESGV